MLGPTQKIDTLNNMAAVHLHLQEFQKARQVYFEVWALRQAIFGPTHPSGCDGALLEGVRMRFDEVGEASKYHQSALKIYRDLQLNEDNPSVARLLTNITSLGRAMSMGYW